LKRTNCVFERSIFARKLISTIETKCDCGYKCTYGDLDEHKKKCGQSIIKCPVEKCSHNIEKLDMLKHISKLHSDQLLNRFDSILQIFKSDNNSIVKTKPTTATNANAAARNYNFSIDKQVNRFGSYARLGSNGKYYCGKRLDGPDCVCCDGYCGTHSGCNCSGCMELDIRYRCLTSGWLVNRDGYVARKRGDSFYCGRRVLDGVLNCDGYCGPSDGPQCIIFLNFS